MDAMSVDKLAEHGQEAAAKAADKALALRHDAAPVFGKVSGRAHAAGKQGIDALSDMLDQARNVLSDASDSIIVYAKKNPAKALGIAAIAGALLYAVLRTLTPRRD